MTDERVTKRQVWTHFVEATLAWPWLWGLWERQFSGAFHNSKKRWRRRSVRPGRFLALWEVNPHSSVGHYEGWQPFLISLQTYSLSIEFEDFASESYSMIHQGGSGCGSLVVAFQARKKETCFQTPCICTVKKRRWFCFLGFIQRHFFFGKKFAEILNVLQISS